MKDPSTQRTIENPQQELVRAGVSVCACVSVSVCD